VKVKFTTLTRLREEAGLSVVELGYRANKGIDKIYKLENYPSNPEANTLLDITKALADALDEPTNKVFARLIDV
jgi:predicted transcriptional regulator